MFLVCHSPYTSKLLFWYICHICYVFGISFPLNKSATLLVCHNYAMFLVFHSPYTSKLLFYVFGISFPIHKSATLLVCHICYVFGMSFLPSKFRYLFGRFLVCHISEEQLKGSVEKRPYRFLAKMKIVKTTPNFACEFVYVC